jgi:hypothetical protein
MNKVMNKGILKNTKAGWFVLYQVMRDEIISGYDSIQLHPDSQTWMDGYNLYEGKEVEFEVRVYPSGTRYAKTIHEDDLGCSYPDCICQGDEITDCKNRTPKQRQTMNKAQTPDQVILGDKTALVENIFHQGLKKTSMQELFNNLESIDIKVPIGVKKVFLDKEEEQIADAFYSGYEDRDLFQHGHDYYNKTYGKL